MAKDVDPVDLAGQLMLQISSGRFFRPHAPLNETVHRQTVYTNAWFLPPSWVELPVGRYLPSTGLERVVSGALEAMDRLEAERADGTREFHIATGGKELIDDIAYVMTFALNRTFSRDYDMVHRLVAPTDRDARRRGAYSLFPRLFEAESVVQSDELEALRAFMASLIGLHREDFARAMRVVRTTVDATRRALYDPTGAYTDIVAALESLSDPSLASPATWDRYDGRKRRIFDKALIGTDGETADRIRQAVLDADHVGVKRRFLSSTLARIGGSYYRDEAVGAIQAPREVEMEKMLSIAYDIRSRRSHVLQDLGTEAWVFTEGAETAYERRHGHILTLAGLWRLTRHVVRQYVAASPPADPTPWDYRRALPGIAFAQWAPQYWVGSPDGLTEERALTVLDGVLRAFIEYRADRLTEGFDLTAVCEKIEHLVPSLPIGSARTAMIGIYLVWHEHCGPDLRRPGADAFLDAYTAELEPPSLSSWAVQLVSGFRPERWSVQQWVELATTRHQERARGREQPMPPGIDALLQLQAADELELVGRHDEAVRFAAQALGEVPGHSGLIEWERALLHGRHDPNFDVHAFLLDRAPTEGSGLETETEAAADAQVGESSPSRTADNVDAAGGGGQEDEAPSGEGGPLSGQGGEEE